MSAVARWYGIVAQAGCLVCRRLGYGYCPAQLHHIIGDNDFSVVPLCETHHDPMRTGSGFHGMGEKKFCEVFKVPALRELGMLVWLHEDLMKHVPRLI